MAFPTDWGRKCALVIQSGQVTDNEVDFPALVTKDTLPSEIFDADGAYPALNGGGDVRFSSDSDGATQLSCEIEQFVTDNDPANGKAAIWVKVPSLSSTTNTTIYIWYNKAGETQPAEDAAYGKESVWDSNFMMVQHMNQDPSGGAPQIIDSTANNNDGTSGGTMLTEDLVDGQINKALIFDGINDFINIGSDPSVLPAIWTATIWVKTTDAAGAFPFGFKSTSYVNLAYSTNCYLSLSAGNYISFTRPANLLDGNWHHVAVTVPGDGINDILNAKMYIDGQERSSSGAVTVSAQSIKSNLYIGAAVGTGGYYSFTGTIDEPRLSNSVRSAGWIETEYANQDSPGTFIIEGTPENGAIITPACRTLSISSENRTVNITCQ